VSAEGYRANAMPASYGKTLSAQQMADLVSFPLLQ
jgi:hypothetical protein